MATPHVAGAFALLRNVYNSATVDDISAALECTGVPVDRAGIVRPRIDVDARASSFATRRTRRGCSSSTDSRKRNRGRRSFGAFSVSGGRYRSNRTPDWKISSIANCNENLAIEARMKHVEPDPERTWNGGIFFKAQLNPTTKTFSGYFAGYNDFGGGQVFINRLHQLRPESPERRMGVQPLRREAAHRHEHLPYAEGGKRGRPPPRLPGRPARLQRARPDVSAWER